MTSDTERLDNMAAFANEVSAMLGVPVAVHHDGSTYRFSANGRDEGMSHESLMRGDRRCLLKAMSLCLAKDRPEMLVMSVKP